MTTVLIPIRSLLPATAVVLGWLTVLLVIRAIFSVEWRQYLVVNTLITKIAWVRWGKSMFKIPVIIPAAALLPATVLLARIIARILLDRLTHLLASNTKGVMRVIP